MITFHETTNEDLIKEIIKEPTLYKLTYGQASGELELDQGLKWFTIVSNGVIIGLISQREVTKIVIEVHPMILPQYWGSGLSIEAFQSFFEYLSRFTKYKKVTTTVPVACDKVINCLQKLNAHVFGLLQNGIIYNNQLMDLLFFEYDLMRVL